MCRFRKKMFTCSHLSDRAIEMCRPGCLSNTICPDVCDDPDVIRSYFPCYQCIKIEARQDADAKTRAEMYATEEAIKVRQVSESKLKEERIRREAKEKADQEREEDLRVKKEKEQEYQRARQEGGLWIETGVGKKSRGRKGGSYGGVNMLKSVPPIMTVFNQKENTFGKESPKKENYVEHGDRAGAWGPIGPRKIPQILSRHENGASQI